MSTATDVLPTTMRTRRDKLHPNGGDQAKRMSGSRCLFFPIPDQCISPLKLTSASRKEGKEKEKAKNDKNLAQMRLSNLKFGTLNFLPQVDKCLNAKLIIPFGKETNLHYIHFILSL